MKVNSKMPDFDHTGSTNARNPKEFTGPDGTYYDTVDVYTPSDSNPPAFMEGGSSRSVDYNSCGSGSDGGGGGSEFLG